MELKYENKERARLEKRSSNRTFMELKLHLPPTLELIINGSNRTFMELKLLWYYKHSLGYRVLIAPLWN